MNIVAGCILLTIWLALTWISLLFVIKDYTDFKEDMIDLMHSQIDVNKMFDEILSNHIYDNDRHVIKTKE